MKIKLIVCSFIFILSTIVSYGQSCTAPYTNARCDLNTLTLPLVPPQAGPNICSSSSLNTCGNLTGAGFCWYDPNFKTKVCRLTDSTTGHTGNLFRSQLVAGSGSGDEQRFNCNSTMVLTDDSGGKTFPSDFTGTSISKLYKTNISWSSHNGFFFGSGQNFFGHNCSNPPDIVYTLSNGQAGTSTTKGSILGHWDFTNHVTPPSFVNDFDFKSSSQCLGSSYTVTWATDGGSDQFDNDFGFGFSNVGGQGTGIDVAVWRRGQGCRHLNLSTLTVTGNWGPIGAITGTTCNTATIHNIKMSKSGGTSGAIEIAATNGCSDANNAPYVWFYNGLNYAPQCTVNCSGHWTSGLNTWINNAGNLPPNVIDSRLNTTPGTSLGLIPSVPSGGIQSSMDSHYGWNSLNDTSPFCGSTTVTGAVVTKAWADEIICYNPLIAQNPWRLASTFIDQTGGNLFDIQNAIGSVSQDGKWFMWTSDWFNTLGGTDSTGSSGTTSCTVGPTGNCRGDVFVAAILPQMVISDSLFGFTENSTNASNFPTVNYKMQRFWDSPPFQWPSINTSSGVFNFANLDTILAQDFTNGLIENMYTLARTPPWATSNPTDTTCHNQTGTGGGHGECYPPVDLNTDGSGTNAIWKAWVTAIATHVNNPSYLLTHGHIKYWEIWNEPDNKPFWAGTLAQLSRLTEDANCIITGRGVIHPNGNGTSVPCAAIAIDPNAKIVMSSGHAATTGALIYSQNQLYCSNPGGAIPYQLPCPNPANATSAAVDIINFHMKPGVTSSINALGIDDSLTGWNYCWAGGTGAHHCTPGGSGTVTVGPTQTINNPSPSKDGASMSYGFTGTSFTDVIFYYDAGANNTATNFTADFWVQTTGANQAAEFDIFQFLHATLDNFTWGSQCVTGAKWQIWNGLAGTWNNTSINCGSLSGSMHHVILNVHRIAGDLSCSGHPCMRYDSLVIDGVLNKLDTNYPAGVLNATWVDQTGVNFQLDTNSGGGAVSANIDLVNLYETAPLENTFPVYLTSINEFLQSAELAKPLWDGEAAYDEKGFTAPYNDPDMAASVMPRMYLAMLTNGISGSAWYTWDSIKAMNSKVSTSYQQTYNYLHGATLSPLCTVNGTVWTCGLTKGTVSYLILWDTSKTCSVGICPTGNVTVPSQWGFWQDMTSVSTPITIVSNTVPVGIKPIILTLAVVPPLPSTVTVIISPSASGSATISPPGVICFNTCIETYIPGTAVTLSESPNGGFSFTGWSGGTCSGTGSCNFNVGSSPISVTSTFASSTSALTVTIVPSGSGTVTSSPAGINCTPTCTGNFAPGTVITLTETHNIGYTFVNWSGACVGTLSTCTFTTGSSASGVTVTFTPNGTGVSPPSGLNAVVQ